MLQKKYILIIGYCIANLFTTLWANITVSGTGEIKTMPNIASFSIVIETTAATAQEAANTNANQTDKTIAMLKTMLVDKQAITTENYNIYPEYTYNSTTNKNEFQGFKASNSISIKTKDIKNLGQLLDKASNSGTTTITNLNFSYDNPEQIYQQALRKAITNSTERAHVLAAASGITIKEIKEITVLSDNFAPSPIVAQARMMSVAAVKQASTPIEAPEVATTANVQVVFRT